jgi:hypothetical protein
MTAPEWILISVIAAGWAIVFIFDIHPAYCC